MRAKNARDCALSWRSPENWICRTASGPEGAIGGAKALNAAFPTNLKLQIIRFGENATAIFAMQKYRAGDRHFTKYFHGLRVAPGRIRARAPPPRHTWA